VPESTFVSEYYLRFRGVSDRAIVLPLDEVTKAFDSGQIDLATNTFSFSECTLAAIEWWLDLLADYAVRYLFISDRELLTTETNFSRRDFAPAIHARGYRLVAREPNYRDRSAQKHAAFPCEHFLFEFQG